MSKICARCEHFTAQGHPEQAALGMGRCHGFDGWAAPVEPFVRWDAPFCVNFGRAKDIGLRNEWIAIQLERDKK